MFSAMRFHLGNIKNIHFKEHFKQIKTAFKSMPLGLI